MLFMAADSDSTDVLAWLSACGKLHTTSHTMVCGMGWVARRSSGLADDDRLVFHPITMVYRYTQTAETALSYYVQVPSWWRNEICFRSSGIDSARTKHTVGQFWRRRAIQSAVSDYCPRGVLQVLMKIVNSSCICFNFTYRHMMSIFYHLCWLFNNTCALCMTKEGVCVLTERKSIVSWVVHFCLAGFTHICVELFVTLWQIIVRLQVCLPKNITSASQMSLDD